MASPVLVWFRDDFRLADNPALHAAAETGAPVLCFYVFDEESEGFRPLGGAARWWLHGSLSALAESLDAIGGELILMSGSSRTCVEEVVAATKASAVHWNRRYGAAEIAVDSALKERLGARGVRVQTYNGGLLHEPWEIRNQSGKPFQVFTPYSRVALSRNVPAPLPAPGAMAGGTWPTSLRKKCVSLARLRLEPSRPDWARGFAPVWERGEKASRDQLGAFLDDGLENYAENRDRPDLEGSSRLSPRLRHGEISPRQVWHGVTAARAENPTLDRGAGKFLTELVWRDFCYQVLFQNPHLATRSHNSRFDAMPWSESTEGYDAWKHGLTGYPMVDAGMRQLWQTGWMHNRVRMIAASFLVKHLLVDWRRGETWFWDTLVDADAANNAFNWQWVAGSGPDSAPFHRIFNPVTQGEKFDPEGRYIRAFIPELARLPDRFIHRPWDAPTHELRAAGVELGRTYPSPVVEHSFARERALQAFRTTQASA